MPTDHRAELAKIKRFDQLIAYLRDQMGWPIAKDSFEDQEFAQEGFAFLQKPYTMEDFQRRIAELLRGTSLGDRRHKG